ncbi:hypothetical protein C6A86_010615 [Mycobacterium sp. ITM-2016-00316]|uniref:hypothetical protein n=1 Tax=Mycobacterium sp. ITM-2016-00316 TaxID=2099695 RepID=UPI000CF8DFAF|nr:hypothetical protein [Mycobacterium sp. ITM-2016-00316]WNG84045.1 hypothetical protein C6A86_010615 [Mycobacterium sp. ITM-2016-00316]
MSFPTLARQVGIPAPNGTFDAERAVAAAIDFCTAHDVARHTRYSVVPRLDQALRIAALTGPDRRWRRMARWSGNNDIEGLPETVQLTDERDNLYNRFVAALPEADWLPPNTVTSVSRWARFSPAMREAQKLGLGWILPVQREVLLVPMPTTRYADTSARVLHCDTGRPAIEWSDGSGPFYLHGTEFDEGLYRAALGGGLSLHAMSAIRNADQRSIAMRYLTFDAAETDGARMLDNNVYRLTLPPRLAGNHGAFAYFTRVGESQSIQWVDPRGKIREGSMRTL